MKTKLKLFVPLLIFAAAFIIELVLGNFVYFSFVAGKSKTVDYPLNNEVLTASGENTQFFFGDFEFPVNSVSLKVKSADEDAGDFSVKLSIYTDDDRTNESYQLSVSDHIPISSQLTEKRFYFNSSGSATGILLSLDGCESDVEISEITINPKYKFNFNGLRFDLILIALTIAYAYKLRCENSPLVPYKSRCRRSIAVSAGIGIFAVVAVAILNATGEYTAPIAYPLTDSVENYDPYIQQFDAFMKGQLHLDVNPAKELLALENPYLPAEREGIYYLWDRAFFDGKYFSYFGIAPIILIYFPHYFIFGSLPYAGYVVAVFAAITAMFFTLAVNEYAKLTNKNKFGYYTAFCAVCGFFASLSILILRGQARFYYVAGMAGMAFASAFILFMLKAIGSQTASKRLAFFALAGLSFGLGFLSRVNSVLPLAIVSAVFVILWAVKRIKEKKIGLCVAEMLSLGAPVIAAVAASMAYNLARFGSPLDFGTDYQLTVADTSLYSVGLYGFIPSVFHYFLQSFKFTAEFPFITFDYIASADLGRYIYVDNGLGIFAMPFMLMLFASPVIFKKKSVSGNRKIIFAAALASLPITAFLNFCLGGVIFRYTSDISLLAAFLASVIAIEAADSVLSHFGKKGYSVFRKGMLCLGGANTAVTLGTVFLSNGNLVAPSSRVLEFIKNIFVFWN